MANKDCVRAYQARNRKKFLAGKRIRWAVSRGRITRQPCEVCGAKKTNAHHDDYDKPREVRWLCTTHHREWHAINGPGKNAAGSGRIAKLTPEQVRKIRVLGAEHPQTRLAARFGVSTAAIRDILNGRTWKFVQ